MKTFSFCLISFNSTVCSPTGWQLLPTPGQSYRIILFGPLYPDVLLILILSHLIQSNFISQLSVVSFCDQIR